MTGSNFEKVTLKEIVFNKLNNILTSSPKVSQFCETAQASCEFLSVSPNFYALTKTELSNIIKLLSIVELSTPRRRNY